jgi:hypothetical protein
MNKELLTFKLNDHVKIIIQLHHLINVIEASYEAHIYFIQDNHKILLRNGSVLSSLERLKTNLSKAYYNNLQLDKKLAENIGYYMNEAVNQEYETEEVFGPNYSILTDYRIWAYSDISTWIYNDSKKNIILEITPSYPYEYVEKEMPYDYFLQWMKSYKPIFKVIISQEIAQQWIEQANLIITEIDKNTEELYA